MPRISTNDNTPRILLLNAVLLKNRGNKGRYRRLQGKVRAVRTAVFRTVSTNRIKP